MTTSFRKFIAPLAATTLALGLSACEGGRVSYGGNEGVPLAELELGGAAPDAVALLGPDNVIISSGAALDIEVDGDPEAVEAMRFTLEGDTLGVMRDQDFWNNAGKATVRITMPPAREFDMAGSGRIEADTMADDAEINIAGSGEVRVASLAIDNLEVNIGGSGEVAAAGSARELEVSIAGSGDVDLSELTAENVEVSIAGSGDVRLASDGQVEANIMGSGDVTVIGSARCELNSAGSGKLYCSPRTAEASESDADGAVPGDNEES